MNLKLHLLIRMTLLGLLCWLGVSLYWVAQSGRRAAQDVARVADQLQPLVAADASDSDWGCTASAPGSGVPLWIARVLSALGPGHISLQREISAFGLKAGTLRVESDDASLLRHQWRSVRELLGLNAVTLLVLELLAF